MKLWSVGYDENCLSNFPQIIYKNRVINMNEEAYLTNKIFDIFLLTHRDEKEKILHIRNSHLLPYKELHNMVYPDPECEFEVEYFVIILNLFNIEI